MAEVFVNSQTRAAGIVTTSTGATIGANATTITGVSTAGVAVGHMVDNQHFRGGAKVSALGVGQVTIDKTSTNSASAASQTVRFMGPTTCYTSPSATKSILIGGTFANLTNNNVNIFVELNSGSTHTGIANDIPVPSGSSFVISDAGKTVMIADDEIRIYCDTSDAVDVTMGILQGVN